MPKFSIKLKKQFLVHFHYFFEMEKKFFLTKIRLCHAQHHMGL